MYKTIEFRVRGVAPQLMHNGQLANPMNKFTRARKAITSKRKKTDEDFAQLADLEFLGGLYVNEEHCPCLPGEVIEATIANAAKKTRKGKDAKAAIIVPDSAALEYEGPQTPDGLKADERFRLYTPVAVGQSRVIRCRPKFKNWEAVFTVHYQDDTFNAGEVVDFVETAGRAVGFGDNRPRFGRFEVVDYTAA